MPDIGQTEIIYIVLSLALGGILKGATGAGAPLAAIPIIALFTNVPFAVTIFIAPNFFSNITQVWTSRAHRLPLVFVLSFALSGTVGAAVGTFFLAELSSDLLLTTVGTVTGFYVILRLLKPDWVLSFELARRLVLAAGLVGGCLQGATGISAPVSITFLNAMRLTRLQFISTISVFFIALLLTQIPILISYGFLNWTTAGLSVAAAIILVAFMPIGAYLTRYLSTEKFNRLLLAILTIVAVRLIFF
jgi:uncharacterized membrane protein YfcA